MKYQLKIEVIRPQRPKPQGNSGFRISHLSESQNVQKGLSTHQSIKVVLCIACPPVEPCSADDCEIIGPC